ncbi:sodium:solute symporter family protein [Propionivibrio sp.]|uniref:sodium:solute symporter family protein n=1 Tax=Propionivibrio sp. TaxID=2212460 RepID=UPI002603F8C4|nr:sodium:solute symporter family protein [Propionivibrio sp.]
MNATVVVTTLVYLAITAVLGYLGYIQTANAKDYLLAGRKVHPVIMAVSYGSTFISTAAIVGFGGAAAVFGMGILWLTVLNIFLGIFIAFIIFGKPTRRMGHQLDAHTFPEFLGKRYDSKFLQVAAAALIFIGMPLYAGAVMLGGVSFLTVALGLSQNMALLTIVIIVGFYVMMGGMKGVMYTDAFQGAIMAIGMTLLLWYAYSGLGGVVSAHEQLTAIADKVPAALVAKGHRGWTAMPELFSPLWWTLISTVVMGVGIGVLAQPQLVVRFMTVKSDRELNRGVVIGGVFIMLMTGVAFVVGSLSNVFFMNASGKIAIAAAGSPDNVIPLFIKNNMPEWYTAVFMITLLAAAMSTLSSQFHTMGSAIGHDIMEKGMGMKAEKPVRIMRIAMLAAILISTLTAYFLPSFFKDGATIIVNGTALFFGLCAGSFLTIYALGLYWKGVSRAGAHAGFLSGLVVSVIVLFFVFEKVSKPLGLSNMIFGVPSLAIGSPLKDIDPLVYAVPVSLLFTVVVSLFSKKPSAAHLAACFPER